MACSPCCECCKQRCRRRTCGCADYLQRLAQQPQRVIIPPPPKIKPPIPLHAFQSQNRRQISFNGFLPIDRARLFATAGFFKVPGHPGNVIQCAYCSVVVWECDYKSWKDPWEEHAKVSQRCPLIVKLPVINHVPKFESIEQANKFDFCGPYFGPDDLVIM